MNSRIEQLKEELDKEVARVDKVLAQTGADKEEKLYKLMESLHVYQTELEMQNVALSESNNDNQTLRLYYSSLFNTSPLPSFVVDERLNIIESNQAAKELYELSKFSMVTQVALTRLFDMETSQTIYQKLRQVKPLDLNSTFELTTELKDGQHDYRCSCKLVTKTDEQNKKFLLVFQDITNDKNLLRQEGVFRELLDNAKEMLLVTDTKGNVLNSSAHLLDFFNVNSNDGLIEKLPKAISAPIQSYLNNELINKRNWQNTIEVANEHEDCSSFIYLRCFPILEGGIVTSAGFILYDDTQRIVQEQELSLAIRVFNEGTQAIMITDAEQNIIQVNLAFEEITGYLTEEVIGEKPTILKSDRQDKAFYQHFWQTIQETGYWEGEIWNRNKNGDIYAQWLSVTRYPKFSTRPTNYIAVFRDITEQKQKEKEIYELAHFDSLTNCGNRRMLKFTVEKLVTKDTTNSFSMFLFDVDHFKFINDINGHEIGDLFLKALVSRFKHIVREQDVIYRLGGDEFLILFNGLPQERIWQKASELIKASQTPFYIKNKEINSSVSIGIAQFPQDGENYDELLRNADAALYTSKSNGRKSFEFFDPLILEKLQREELLERGLRQAFKEGGLQVAYMPIIAKQTKQAQSVELLLRWKNSELGFVSPEEFVPIAESTGMIHDLTLFVLKHAVELIKYALNNCPNLSNVSINLSGLDLKHSDFLFRAIESIDSHVLSHLTFEITEGILLEDTEEHIKTITRLRNSGIKVSIDDFGTGYSSLSYLSNFAVDEIKIDKTFIDKVENNEKSQQVCAAILTLIKALGCHSVAEGVESKGQLEWLEQHGCNFTQGFYHSKPISFDELVNSKLFTGEA